MLCFLMHWSLDGWQRCGHGFLRSKLFKWPLCTLRKRAGFFLNRQFTVFKFENCHDRCIDIKRFAMRSSASECFYFCLFSNGISLKTIHSEKINVSLPVNRSNNIWFFSFIIWTFIKSKSIWRAKLFWRLHYACYRQMFFHKYQSKWWFVQIHSNGMENTAFFWNN